MCEKINMNKEIEIGCPRHGAFFVTPNNHLGYNTDLVAHGCPKCNDFKKVVITKDNIHLYYEFMSDEDLEKYGYILNDIFENRQRNISNILKINLTDIELMQFEHYAHFQIVGLISYGIKDTLKPTDEYIEEIKGSSEYKNHFINLSILGIIDIDKKINKINGSIKSYEADLKKENSKEKEMLLYQRVTRLQKDIYNFKRGFKFCHFSEFKEFATNIRASDEYKEYVYTSIDDYQNRLTDEQKEIVIKHCDCYSIKPIICAWYDDTEDFYSDWVEDLGYSKDDADDLLAGNRDNKEEFITFSDGQIIRFSI